MAGQESSKVIAVNRKARHDYFVIEAMEAGIELMGTEVKSIRTGAVNLKDAWVEVDGGELYVLGMHVSPYEPGSCAPPQAAGASARDPPPAGAAKAAGIYAHPLAALLQTW